MQKTVSNRRTVQEVQKARCISSCHLTQLEHESASENQALRGRDAMLQLVMVLDDEGAYSGERLIRTTSALLKTHMEKWEKERGSGCKPEDCSMNPLEFFCHVQAKNTANEISIRIADMNLTYLHIRELLQNLFGLVNFIRQKSIESAKFFWTHYLQVLVPIVQDIETKLAIFDKAPLIEWETALKRVGNFETRYTTVRATAASKRCSETNSKGVPSETAPFTHYIPSISDFKVGKVLGKGSFGAVYEAKYRDEIPCAVKVSVSTGVSCEESTLRRELSLIDKVVASIVSNHPFVVRFLACFLAMAPNNTENQVADVQPPRAHITVMELVQGIDLSVFATRFRLCGRELAVHIIAQLAMAVEHFHLCGLIHRDIKLSNTMILQNARVKLIDFDVSKICIAHFSRIYSLSYFRRTPMEFRVPEKIGTAAYMAPELHLNQRFGRAIDWWSLGVVAFRLFLGRLPFRGSCEKMMEQITKQNIDWDSSTSKVPGTKDAKARSIRDFLSAILKKAPTARLGSHSYDDIFAHEIFAGFDWERLSRKDFDCPPLREFIGQGQEAQRRDEEDDNAGMDGLGIKHCKRVKPLNFCDVEDLQTSQHVKLHTFTSATIMNLIAKRDGGNDFLDEPPSMRHITNLCRKGSNEDALSGEIGQLCELEPANPETVKFVCDLKRKPVVLCRSSPVLFQQMVGFDGQPKLVVRKVISRELAVSLFEGDVIVRIAGADAAAWNSHSAEALFAVQSCIPIEVIADNAYRFSKTSSLAVDDIKARFGVLSIDFVQSDKDCWMLKKWRYGFVPRTLEFWNFKIMESRKVLVVAQFDLHRQHTAEPTSKLFFGDIILSVNEETDVDQCLREVKQAVKNIKIIPCSPLRNPLINLVSPPDYRPTQ